MRKFIGICLVIIVLFDMISKLYECEDVFENTSSNEPTTVPKKSPLLPSSEAHAVENTKKHAPTTSGMYVPSSFEDETALDTSNRENTSGQINHSGISIRQDQAKKEIGKHFPELFLRRGCSKV